MLRLPAVAGQFYPANPLQLSSLVRSYTRQEPIAHRAKVRACMVPHAGYMYSGAVAGAVFQRISIPGKILLLGVRHFPRGEAFAILSEGAWRTPLGDAPVATSLADALRKQCPVLREDAVAHSREHSLEVEIPFLQVLAPGFWFVPVAIGSLDYEDLQATGAGIARVFEKVEEEVLIVCSSDMNHYEDDATTRLKDEMAIERLLHLDAQGLFEVCRRQKISMCGLGPAITMLIALKCLGAGKAELVRYATSGDVSGNRSEVVGYAGMVFY